MPPPLDQVRFRRPLQIPGLELVSVSYRRRAFPLHVHEDYVVGVMMAGAERLTIRGGDHVARLGDLILIEPGEPHANQSEGDAGLAYRVFYIPPDLIAEAAAGPVRFRRPVSAGGALAQALADAHRRLGGEGERLEQESAFFLLLAGIIERESGEQSAPRPAEQRQVATARACLDARYAESVSLVELSRVAGLSPFHLLRSFRDQVGLTPGAYQIQLRIREARRLLRQGAAIAETATALGFADQSHLTRHFQRIVGTSPGRYAQQ
jgi:AraC-like DNA-binding protein